LRTVSTAETPGQLMASARYCTGMPSSVAKPVAHP
jgi:hypothetical protein